MVSQAEFDRVQEIINPRRATRPKDKTLEFPLRGLFVCGECGFSITAEKKYKNIKSTGERKEYIYYHCTGKAKNMKCTQPHLHVTEDEPIRQLKEKLSRYTIDPDFYKLAIEALAQEEDEVVAKDAAKHQAWEQAITKNQEAIAGLRRMRYSGEVNDDDWYFSEMKTIEERLESLQKARNDAEHKTRNWREIADEVFTFARYAKEDFDNDDLEKKRAAIVKLGEKLSILDRTIQFTPNKYFVPIEKMNESTGTTAEKVITNFEQNKNPKESKTTPVGVDAVPEKLTQALGLNVENSLWLRLQVTNSLTGVERYKSDTVCIELDRSINKPLGGIAMSDKEQLKRDFTDEECLRLVDYFSLLIEIDQQEKARFAKLKDFPKGFAMDGEGRQCGLCCQSVHETPGWFDKWGFKCSNCQDAVNKRKIPGSLCGDYRHEKSIPDTLLASKLNISVRTIRKNIKDDHIIGRKIPNGPHLLLKRENPKLSEVLLQIVR